MPSVQKNRRDKVVGLLFVGECQYSMTNLLAYREVILIFYRLCFGWQWRLLSIYWCPKNRITNETVVPWRLGMCRKLLCTDCPEDCAQNQVIYILHGYQSLSIAKIFNVFIFAGNLVSQMFCYCKLTRHNSGCIDDTIVEGCAISPNDESEVLLLNDRPELIKLYQLDH